MRMKMFAIIASVASLSFIGCGDDDEDTGSEDSAVEEAEEAEEQE